MLIKTVEELDNYITAIEGEILEALQPLTNVELPRSCQIMGVEIEFAEVTQAGDEGRRYIFVGVDIDIHYNPKEGQ